MSHPIPSGALAHHIAFLGKTGSGKSNAAKVIAEEALDAGERICIVDPTGSWWGLRLKANGKPSNYPVVIFGGLHGDVAIGGSHGAAVAEVVATSATPAVVDTRLMSVGDRTRFFTDFAETLLRKNRGPLRLVIDEAHLFAPQSGGSGGKDVPRNLMLHAANNLVSLGRSAGLRIMMLSQRPAKLHKDSLTQVETLVAMRLMHNLDVDAVKVWIGEWADKEQGKEIVVSLPSLPTGDAWVWSPEIGFLDRVHFPLARTYDSGKAPTDGDAGPELKPLDLEAVTALLDKAAVDIKANDPRALKGEIARLSRELAAAQKSAPAPAWPDQRETVQRLAAELSESAATLERLSAGATELQRRQAAALAALQGERVEVPVAAPVQRRAPVVEHREARIRDKPVPSIEGVTPPQQRILDALAWWRAFGIVEPTSEQVAFRAGYSASSSGYANLKGAMRTSGLIDYPKPGRLAFTDAGSALAHEPNAPTTREAFHDAVRAKLEQPQLRLLNPLIDAYPDALSSDALADASGYSTSSSGYANLKGRMRSLGFLDYPTQGHVRAADWLFP